MERIPVVLFLLGAFLAGAVESRAEGAAERVQESKAQHDMTALAEFATRYAAAWSNQDPVAFAAFYAENASFRINDGTASIGRAAIE